MEFVSFLAGEPHSDRPACVSPLLRGFCVAFNDALDDDLRQRLRPYLARMIGTAGDGRDEERAWLCADWVVRVYGPAWLDLAGLTVLAARLRALPEVASPEAAHRAKSVLEETRSEAAAVGAADWPVVARDAAGVAAWAAACAVAGVVAWDAVWTAVEGLPRPTVVELHRSMFDLLDRMLPTEPLALPAVATANRERVPVGVH